MQSNGSSRHWARGVHKCYVEVDIESKRGWSSLGSNLTQFTNISYMFLLCRRFFVNHKLSRVAVETPHLS